MRGRAGQAGPIRAGSKHLVLAGALTLATAAPSAAQAYRTASFVPSKQNEWVGVPDCLPRSSLPSPSRPGTTRLDSRVRRATRTSGGGMSDSTSTSASSWPRSTAAARPSKEPTLPSGGALRRAPRLLDHALCRLRVPEITPPGTDWLDGTPIEEIRCYTRSAVARSSLAVGRRGQHWPGGVARCRGAGHGPGLDQPRSGVRQRAVLSGAAQGVVRPGGLGHRRLRLHVPGGLPVRVAVLVQSDRVPLRQHPRRDICRHPGHDGDLVHELKSFRMTP